LAVGEGATSGAVWRKMRTRHGIEHAWYERPRNTVLSGGVRSARQSTLWSNCYSG